MVLTFTLPDKAPAQAADITLTAPEGVNVNIDGTNFIVKWQNPEGLGEFAKSAYENWEGALFFIVDWRVNGGAWHYDREIPSGKGIYDIYPNISMQFYGAVYDAGYSKEIISQTAIDKVLIGIPYDTAVEEWLNDNNVEFRVRYIYNYWDASNQEDGYRHSSFSAPFMLGTANPTGNTGGSPVTGEFGMPEAPSSIEAPEGLVSEYMTLGLRWRIPESVKTLIDMQNVIYSVIDWKLNDGEWHDGMKGFEEVSISSLIDNAEYLCPDKYGYVMTSIDRQALGIPYDIPLTRWLSDKTYYFRVRYFLQVPDESEVRKVISPYSNIVTLGLGTTAPTAPSLEAPSGLTAQTASEYGNPKINFSWTVPDSISEINKTLAVTTYIDVKPEGGKWLTEREGLEGALSTTGDLRDNNYIWINPEDVRGIYCYRIFFASEYKPDSNVYSGFSNIVTVDTRETASDETFGGKAERLWGNDRFKTAAVISKKGWEKADNVVLVDGNNFPDALAGSSFAYLKDAPILITESNALNSNTKNEIERLGAKTIYILGSYDSISRAVEDDLKGKYTVVRIGGTGVFDTAVKVGEEVRKIRQFNIAAIATQNDFPDALAIAHFSARDTIPILFSEKDKLRPDTKKALQDWGIEHVIISGGSGVVSDAVENELEGMGIYVERLWGSDRYATALEVARRFETQNGYTSISAATGRDYPDALTGAVFAAKNNAPVFLVDKDSMSLDIIKYIKAQYVNKIYVFGGSGVVSDNVINQIVN